MTLHNGPWPAGFPCWVDVTVSDLEHSQAFYAAVLGWRFSPGAPQLGGYTNAFIGDRRVAGLSPSDPGASRRSSVWAVYLAAPDIEQTDKAIRDAGGQEVFPITGLAPLGRMAMYTDTTGSVFGVYEANKHTGFNIVEEPGTVAWCEGMVGEFEPAKAFYTTVFGYTYTDMSGPAEQYAMFTAAGAERPTGGIGVVGEHQSPRWTVTFEVADVDAAARQVSAHGGIVVTQPYDFEYGRLALCEGPDNEGFGLITSKTAG